MRPLDPRLMRYAASAKGHIVTIAVLGTLTAALVIAQALLISATLSPVVQGGASFNNVLLPFCALVIVVILRAVFAASREALSHRAAKMAIRELREKVIDASLNAGPRWRSQHGTETTALLTRGLDDLGPYFVRFLPQLIMVSTVTPLALFTMLLMDFWSAVIAVLTVPLIPIFMILIGRFTQESSSARLTSMQQLSSQLLDLISGLPTLRALGRHHSPRAHLATLSEKNTKVTMATLRVAFLSGGVLEFLATLSVALVAVEVGMRLVYDHLSLFSALAVIMLAPEVYEPLRQVGAQFHASANGVAAANAAFDIIENAGKDSDDANEDVAQTSSPCPDLSQARITFNAVSVAARGMWAPAKLSATITPGTITALAGPSGVGKTTTVFSLLKLHPVTQGRITIGNTDLSDIPAEELWRNITWIPQAPSIQPGTLRDHFTPDISEDALNQAAVVTGFDSVLRGLRQGWDTPIGHGGVGFSVGQCQRLALTAAMVASAPLIILDEPTAHLDAVTEETVIAAITALKEQGKTVLVIAHRPSLLKLADHVITIQAAQASEQDVEQWPILAATVARENTDFEMPDLLDSSVTVGSNSTKGGR